MIGSIRDILLVTDMDGTMLNEEKKILRCNIEALRLFKQLGGRFTIATGRDYASIYRYPELVELMEPGIASGGAVLYDYKQHQPVKLASLPQASAWQALRDLRSRFPFIGFFVSGNDMRMYQAEGNSYTQRLVTDENFPYFVYPDDCLPGDWNKIVFAGDPQKMPMVHEYVRNAHYPGLYFVVSQECYMEMLPEGINKATGVRELCAMLGMPMEHTVVIGDYYNDIEMMRAAGHAIAMGNAPPEVRREAAEVTLSCEDGGVGHAIYKLIRSYGG